MLVPLSPLSIVCFFTFIIHMSESLAYGMRLAGVRTRQIAIAMAFVTSTLLVSRLSNLFQAPLLGAMVDFSILTGQADAIQLLEFQFRTIIICAALGAFSGSILTPTMVRLYAIAIKRFMIVGSIPKVVGYELKPTSLKKIIATIRLPRLNMLSNISLAAVPKQFLIINFVVTSIYCIGVLCALLAGANQPEFRSTAIQLSGIVNGMATILFTIFVDPPGARLTDQAVNGKRAISDVKSVVFFLQLGKIMGTLILSQLLLGPLTQYIIVVTKWLTTYF